VSNRVNTVYVPHNLKAALCILKIQKLRANLEIVLAQFANVTD